MNKRAAIVDTGIITAMNSPALYQPFFAGASWDGWKTILKAAFALPMSDAEREFFRSIAERDPPTSRVREMWVIAGRRAGKDSIASVIAAHSAALFNQNDRLRRGERALVMCLACEREQAKIVMNYTRSFFNDIPSLRSMVTRRTASGFELNNGIDIAIATNSFRSVRGRPVLCAILDEVSFWRDDASATPDEETYAAVKPGMATLPGAMLIGISTPYRKAGLLYKKFRDHYGHDGDILVVRAPSATLNPTLDQAIIDQAFADDPALASAEWMAEFRSDIDAFVSRDVIDAAVVPGRYELPPMPGITYMPFVDPAGGSGQDSMVLSIFHHDRERDCFVQDFVRERKPPYSPADVTAEFVAALKAYHCSKVTGDNWGGEYLRQPFRAGGVDYDVSKIVVNDIYRDSLPMLNSGKVELLDLPKQSTQLVNLIRITSRTGNDTITHPKNQHDDLANAACGALLLAASQPAPMNITPQMIAQIVAAGQHQRRFPQQRQHRCF
jgi:hypothetical protein